MFIGICLSLITCFCWGSTSVCLRGIRKLSGTEMTLCRAIGGFGAAAVIAAVSVDSSAFCSAYQNNFWVFVLLVLFNNVVGDIFLFLSLHNLGVALGAAISSTYPVIVAICSVIMFHEHPTIWVVLGTVLVVCGAALLSQKGERSKRVSASGLVCAVLAAAFWALGLVCNKILIQRDIAPNLIVAGRGITFLAIAAAIWLANDVALNRGFRHLPIKDSLLGVLAGVLSLGCGALFYSMALERVPATVATPIGAANPFLASLAAWAFFNEKLNRIQWFGMAVTITGTVLVTL